MKLILSIALTLFLLGCSDDEAVANRADEATKAAEVVVKKAMQETQTAAAQTQNAVADVKKVVDETTKEAVAEIKEATLEASLIVEEVVVSTVSGVDLYKACAGCHGQKAEKAALGKSQILQGWSAAKIAASLHGYKEGTYGGSTKALMNAQAAKLSDADIQAVSEYISGL